VDGIDSFSCLCPFGTSGLYCESIDTFLRAVHVDDSNICDAYHFSDQSSLSVPSFTVPANSVAFMGFVRFSHFVSFDGGAPVSAFLGIGNNGFHNAFTMGFSKFPFAIMCDPWGESLSWNSPMPLFNTWFHLACQINSTNSLEMYFNGQLVNTRQLTGGLNVAAASELYLGRSFAAHGQPNPAGRLRDVRIYNRVMSQSEISTIAMGAGRLFDTSSSPAEILLQLPLTMNYMSPLRDHFVDLSGNNNHAYVKDDYVIQGMNCSYRAYSGVYPSAQSGSVGLLPVYYDYNNTRSDLCSNSSGITRFLGHVCPDRTRVQWDTAVALLPTGLPADCVWNRNTQNATWTRSYFGDCTADPVVLTALPTTFAPTNPSSLIQTHFPVPAQSARLICEPQFTIHSSNKQTSCNPIALTVPAQPYTFSFWLKDGGIDPQNSWHILVLHGVRTSGYSLTLNSASGNVRPFSCFA
jgi:hypothetical protein